MDWEFGSKAGSCTGCSKKFEEEQELFSALYDDQTAFARRDFCEACWDNAEREKPFSFWKTRVPRRDEPVKKIVSDDVLIDMFQRLEGAEEETRRNFRFVLALLLMRRKVLKYVEMKRDDTGTALILQDRVRNCRCEVYDPGLSEDKIQEVTEEVSRLLDVQP